MNTGPDPAAQRPGRGRLPALPARLARHVLWPLAAVWLAGVLIVVQVTSNTTHAAFDRALLDDALGLAASVTRDGDGLRVDLTASELKAVLFDQSESVHYAVYAADGRLVAGDGKLRAAQLARGQRAAFADVDFDGQSLRAVSLRGEGPLDFELVLAQTTASRTASIRTLFAYVVVPEALLLLALGFWLRRAIRDDVRPIVELERELNRRGPLDLQPLAVPAGTREVDGLVRSIDTLMQRVEQGVRAQREFTGNVAHELRTPLAGIRALAEFGLATDDPARSREQLASVLQSQERASRLVDQLLGLALADEAGALPALQPLALDALVRRVVLQGMGRADAAGVDLGADGLDEPCTVLGDEGLIEGVLQNLLDNALRYGRPAEGRSAVITVALAVRPDGGVDLSVTDNGPGLGEAERQAVTSRWQRGRVAESTGQGSGLGLFIASRYAELLGARLTLDAAEGGGTRATLALPAPQDATGVARPVDGPG